MDILWNALWQFFRIELIHSLLWAIGLIAFFICQLERKRETLWISVFMSASLLCLCVAAFISGGLQFEGTPSGIDKLEIGKEYRVLYLEYPPYEEAYLVLQDIEYKRSPTLLMFIKIEEIKEHVEAGDTVIVTSRKELKVIARHDGACG